MARPLHGQLPLPHLTSISNTTNLLLLVASVAAIASLVISLCTTHKHSRMRKGDKERLPTSPSSTGEDRKLLSNLGSSFSSKAMVVAKMVPWKKDGEANEEALWKKTIIMGEKCRPVDFSGQILYDSEGNQLPEAVAAARVGRLGQGPVRKA